MSNLAEELNIEPTDDESGIRWYPAPGPLGKPSSTAIIEPITPKSLSNWHKRTSEKQIEKVVSVAQKFGTDSHGFFENVFKGVPFEVPESHAKHVANFQQWVKDHRVKPMSCERYVESDKYGYAGRTDFIGEIDGQIVIADWKTSRSYSIKNGWQLASYRRAAIEMGLVPETCGMVGLQVARDTAEVKMFKYEHIDFCEHAFLCALDVFKALYFKKLNDINWKWLKERAV